ncbi:MAG: selenium metabolism-associated LysR family transcriptional regulator [Eubacteriales bacterium]|nr:selenium metabolism-associated LysR family transcriptional regulator [Eubacteriales bacterium]
MSNISLKQLEVLIAVVEQGSFTAAAEHLYLAQSTVSSHISALEEALRVVLFRRESKKNITLTADGKRVYRYAKDVVSRCSALESELNTGRARELVIGASTAPSKGLLPEQLRIFSESHPECCCVVKSGDSERIQQMVLDGDIQIGFVGSTDNRQALTYECVAEDRLVMITPNTPRFAALKEQGVLGRELLGEPMIFRDHGSGTQKMIDNYLSEQGNDAVRERVRYYASDPELLQQMVALGCGVSILSALSVQEQVTAGTLLTFELEKKPVSRNIYMVYRKKNDLSDLAREFARQVRQNKED